MGEGAVKGAEAERRATERKVGVLPKSVWSPVSVTTLSLWSPISVTVKSGCLQEFSSAKPARTPTARGQAGRSDGPLRNGMKAAVTAAPLRLSKRRRHYRMAGGKRWV